MKIEHFDFAHTQLTRKQLQIIAHLCNGLPHKQIADRQGIKKDSVDQRVSYLVHKAHVSNSKELVALAIEQGMQRNGFYRGVNLFAPPEET